MPVWLRLPAALCALLATAAAAHATPPPSGTRGVVLDTTCYGPCAIDDDPQPYRGENARIVVRKPSDPSFRRGAPVEQGHFRIRLAPGVYRLTAFIPGRCWEGETRRVGVHRGEFRRLELQVQNVCIV